MPIADLIYNSDINCIPTCSGTTSIPAVSQPDGTGSCTCSSGDKIYVVMPPPPPPHKFPLYPYPPYPVQPDDCDCNSDNTVKQTTIERQICKLSKKAATLRTLIENISEKNKPVIIKSGAVSYSLGEYVANKGEELESEDESIGSIIEILKAKLEEVKTEIKELSDEITTDE